MSLLEHENYRDNCRGDLTHRQPMGKQTSYRPYKRISSLNGYLYKEYFLDCLFDLKDLFDHQNIPDERKVKPVLYRFNEYALRQWERIQFDRIQQGKDKIRSQPRMKKKLAIMMNFCHIQNKIIGQEVHT